ncbi:ATP-binding cassette domain-containing protein [Methanobrevibacter sp.]|uniref:sulfate/molybdate ABC transporter ATP-binding protein n=1 Tax=Methanobrevibacter sp. TaxID=66852 RepID=UPI0025D4C77F|nr:ATP-binding cassette domain-containing protein [Methanobrevibacter sp.]MBQ2961348.1 ATP-binding cassette domain-containing protein [Methanobrevibacter sp.]
MTNELLKVDIQKRLKEFDLDVDFELKKGCLGILGPSGCGKSMTLKSIAGIVDPDDGIVSLNGKTYFDSSAKINLKPQKRNVGYLFQNYALFPNMTVEENVAIGLGKDYDRDHLSQIIKRFHLDGLEKRYPRQLSGGQQQRVALARILAYGPDVILLDEPFSAMDTFLKEQLRLELINSLKDFDGFSILVTHNRDEAFQFCDELIILDQGKIIAKGETHDVFENPRKVQVARLTGCKNISRVEIIDDYHLKSLDWGLEFEVSQKISPNVTHMGIRAHDFSSADKDAVNAFGTENSTKIEMPFEWEITLENGLWWKYDKQIYEHEFEIPDYLKVDPKNIILLEEYFNTLFSFFYFFLLFF